MNNNVVLDSSALLALLQQESGSNIVEPLLSTASISSVNAAEVLTVMTRINMPSEEAQLSIHDMVKAVVPFDLGQAQKVADLYFCTKERGLSLGDRACIALGIKLKAPIYTADKIWMQLSIDDADIRVIR
jgi:ribonuclease VapC